MEGVVVGIVPTVVTATAIGITTAAIQNKALARNRGMEVESQELAKPAVVIQN